MTTSISFVNDRPFFGGYFLDEVWTHAGVFHADDVFCVALIRHLYPDARVHRVRALPPDLPPGSLSFDLAGAPFDHHVSPVPKRRDGQSYSSFGTMWASLGRRIVQDSVVWEGVDVTLVRPIDVADNGGSSCFVSELILGMNTSDELQDLAFESAVNMAIGLLDAVFQKYSGLSVMLNLLQPFIAIANKFSAPMVELPFFRSDVVPYIRSMAPSVKYILSPDTSVASSQLPLKSVKYALRSLAKNVSFKPSISEFTGDSLPIAGNGILFVHARGNMLVFNNRKTALAFLDCHLKRLGVPRV